MILKNPYKILVKNYRVINLLLLIPTIYLLITCTNLAEFFREYVSADCYTAETDLVDIYLPALTMISAVVTAIIHFAVWVLLTVKKKKNYYHAISAGYHLLIFLAIVFFYTCLLNIEMGNIESTFANFIRDVSDLVIYPFYVLLVMGGINVVGLNIKTLRFDKHSDLRLTEEDEEDIELKVGTDTNNTKKRFIHIIRELKYYVIENKIIIGILIVVIAGMIGYKAFINYQIYNPTYNLNQSFALDSFALSVKESYITPYDFTGRVISKDRHYLAVKIGIHNKGKETTISKDVFRLVIGDEVIFPSFDRSSRFVDIGKPYQGEIIAADEAHDYVFVYELTEKQLKSKYELRILNDLRVDNKDLSATYKKINVRPEYLTEQEKEKAKKLKDKITFSESTLKRTTYKLKNVKIVSSYKYTYELCYTERNCQSIEDIIVPSGGKVLMILEDELEYDSSTSYSEFKEKNFYENFMTVQYTFDVKTGATQGPVTQIGNIKEITPKSITDKKIFEVPSNMQDSYKINFLITVRNKLYTIKVLE